MCSEEQSTTLSQGSFPPVSALPSARAGVVFSRTGGDGEGGQLALTGTLQPDPAALAAPALTLSMAWVSLLLGLWGIKRGGCVWPVCLLQVSGRPNGTGPGQHHRKEPTVTPRLLLVRVSAQFCLLSGSCVTLGHLPGRMEPQVLCASGSLSVKWGNSTAQEILSGEPWERCFR